MKGDFTRDTFDTVNHFSRVLMQQGRVQLDADWNEQTSILLHYIQTLARDLIGPYGGPADDSGFTIKDFGSLTADEKKALGLPDSKLKAGDFYIGKGRYYVDGILCEIDRPVTFATQPDWPAATSNLLDKGYYLIYLDVLERHVTALDERVLDAQRVEDEDGIRESALGGPDTCSRAKVVWQVKWELANADMTCKNLQQQDAWRERTEKWQPSNRGHMRASLETVAPSKNPCITDPSSLYRGQENQLYRVEIHRAGPKDGNTPATFKWSRDNGSVVAGVVEAQGNTLTLSHSRGFEPDIWVELTSEDNELNGVPGDLYWVKNVEGDTITLDAQDDSNTGDDDDDTALSLAGVTLVRRWDQQNRGDVVLAEGAAPIVEGEWIPLENGIQVWFDAPAKGEQATRYRTGDYWLIPARVATGKIEWPTQPKAGKPSEREAAPRTPHGVTHHYAPLTLASFDGAKVTVSSPDCRCIIRPTNSCAP